MNYKGTISGKSPEKAFFFLLKNQITVFNLIIAKNGKKKYHRIRLAPPQWM